MKSFRFPYDHDVMRDYLDGDYEPEVAAAIARNVGPGTRCLNVGANVGYFAFLMHCLGGEVVALEPDPKNAECLRQNCPGITVIEAAASDREGKVTMWRDWQNSGNTSMYRVGKESFEADAIRIADLQYHADFALFDCQGHDHIALKGSSPWQPTVAVVEHWPQGIELSGWSSESVHRLYFDLDYAVDELDALNLLLTRST